jgi:HK97 family phage portal protein
MAFFGKRGRKGGHESAAIDAGPAAGVDAEARSQSAEGFTQSDPRVVEIFGLGNSGVSEVVTLDTAYSVPAIWAANVFLSDTMASLPMKVYQKNKDGTRGVASDHPVLDLLNHAANDETDAFEHRRGFWLDFFGPGRGLSFIEGGRGAPSNLWPIEPARCRVTRNLGRRRYHYNDYGRAVIYDAPDVIDLSFMPTADRLGSRSPIFAHAPTIGLALAVKKYGAKFFDNGGVPPFVIEGPMTTPGGVARSSEQLSAAVVNAARQGDLGIALPAGHKITAIGIDPEKMQMVDVQRFLIEDIARIYGVPPVFLQDLTHGTFTNTEQQDLFLVKHSISRHANAFEKQANLKLFGRGNREFYVEHDLDGLMRGDLVSRADALAKMINSGQLTPNETRTINNRPTLSGGDRLLVQGAMVPADSMAAAVAPGADGDTNKGSENA